MATPFVHPVLALCAVIVSLMVIFVVFAARRDYRYRDRRFRRARQRLEDARTDRDFLAWERARQLLKRDRL